jgi:ankyrin repeat protein
MFKGLFNSKGKTSNGTAGAVKAPTPQAVKDFCKAAGAADKEAVAAYIARYGNAAIDLPCPETGYSALMRAAMHGEDQMCKVLLDAGADVNWKDKDGWTPLRAAVNHNRQATAKFLISRKADVNMADAFGDTPLMKAADEGNAGIVELLLDSGADPRAVNGTRQSAARAAEQASLQRPAKAYTRIIETLLAAERAAENVEQARRDAAAAMARDNAEREVLREINQGLSKSIAVPRQLRLKGQAS